MMDASGLFLFLCLLHHSRADVHSFSAFFIGSQGLHLPDYIERVAVDDVTMFYYNSSMNGELPCPEWLSTPESCQVWKDINLISLGNRYRMASYLQAAMLQFNLTGPLQDGNVYQAYSRCELYPDGTRRAVLIHAFNGKDFLSFDIDRKLVTASVPQAVVHKRQREEDPVLLEIVGSFYKKTCFERLNMFLQHAPALKEKKVPEVRLFRRTKSGSTVLTCHVTGFYPRDVQVEWTGAGLQSVDEELMDVLHNGDGTYQTRRNVIRPEENPEGQAYSCVVHHSSVAGNITKTWVTEDQSRLALWLSPICVVLIITGAGLLLRRLCKSKDVHSITAFFIGSKGLNLPDYIERITVDGLTMFHHDSSMNIPVPCPEWLNTTEGRQHWNDINLISQHNKNSMATALESAMLQFNLTGYSTDVNVYQAFSRCDLYPDGTHKAVLTHAFNGKDFLTLDIDRKTYTASVPQAVMYKRQREANPVLLEIMIAFYKRTCFERLKMFLQHAPGVTMKKVPEVSLFKRTTSGSTVLTCHVTGFYPRDVEVEWIGAGLQSVDEELMDVLPNGD
ncbi:hypothetical protein NFI96_015870, partial [Prochilodus magdalenae]